MCLDGFLWNLPRSIAALLNQHRSKLAAPTQLNQSLKHTETIIQDNILASCKIASIRRSNPTILPLRLSNSCSPISRGRSLPSTNLITNMMPLNAQHVVWYSLPYGCGLRGQYIHSGHVQWLCQIDIGSSRQIVHPETKNAAMFALNAAIISRTCQNLSRKAGGAFLVKRRQLMMTSNLLLDM
mmetsp:Transcript_26170/g.44620  ORF Transcript_26170/g.44620 Transcript_26170/m.44620 type:complete len:183 (+) Transcript_26170:934-1482(+)